MTGFFYTFKRPRTSLPMGMLKYDPIGMNSSNLSKLRYSPPPSTLLISVVASSSQKGPIPRNEKDCQEITQNTSTAQSNHDDDKPSCLYIVLPPGAFTEFGIWVIPRHAHLSVLSRDIPYLTKKQAKDSSIFRPFSTTMSRHQWVSGPKIAIRSKLDRANLSRRGGQWYLIQP